MRMLRLFALPALLAPALALAAPRPAHARAAIQSQAPVLTFEKPHHDFGKVSPDRKVAYRFKATNTGNAMLNITHLNPSCGCTATVPGKWSLNPGESTDIEATFNPAGMKGLVRKSIQVTSNDPKSPIITLTFEAEVTSEVNLKTSLLTFLDVPKSQTRRATTRLESGNGAQVVVTDVKIPAAPYLTPTWRSEGKDVVLDMAFDPRKVPAGQSRGVDTVTIRTGSASQPVVTMYVQWELKAAILPNPEKVVWRDSPGKELRATVTLKHADGKPFSVTGARPSLSLLRVEGLGRKAAQQDLVLVLSAAAKTGTYNEKVVLATDDPDQPQVEVRVVAFLN